MGKYKCKVLILQANLYAKTLSIKRALERNDAAIKLAELKTQDQITIIKCRLAQCMTKRKLRFYNEALQEVV